MKTSNSNSNNSNNIKQIHNDPFLYADKYVRSLGVDPDTYDTRLFDPKYETIDYILQNDQQHVYYLVLLLIRNCSIDKLIYVTNNCNDCIVALPTIIVHYSAAFFKHDNSSDEFINIRYLLLDIVERVKDNTNLLDSIIMLTEDRTSGCTTSSQYYIVCDVISYIMSKVDDNILQLYNSEILKSFLIKCCNAPTNTIQNILKYIPNVSINDLKFTVKLFKPHNYISLLEEDI